MFTVEPLLVVRVVLVTEVLVVVVKVKLVVLVVVAVCVVVVLVVVAERFELDPVTVVFVVVEDVEVFVEVLLVAVLLKSGHSDGMPPYWQQLQS